MKKVLASALLLTTAAASFANETDDLSKQNAFYGYTNHNMYKKETLRNSKAQPVPFFIGYRVLFADRSNSTDPLYKFGKGGTTETIYPQWNWEIGHEGVVGVTLKKSLFSIFAKGSYVKHKRINENTSALLTDEEITLNDFSFPIVVNSDVANNRSIIVESKARLLSMGLFLSYTAYNHGHFFLMPYVGPSYLENRIEHLGEAVVSLSQDGITVYPSYKSKYRGWGPMLGTTGKFYFNQHFYIAGDLRLGGHYLRQNETKISYPIASSDYSRSNTNEKEMFSMVFAQNVGFGLHFYRKNYSVDFLLSYENFQDFGCDIAYHMIGAGLVLGF